MEWRKSSFCSSDHVTEQCIKVTKDNLWPSDRLFISDPELNDLPLVTSRDSFRKFVQGVKAGEFDDLV